LIFGYIGSFYDKANKFKKKQESKKGLFPLGKFFAKAIFVEKPCFLKKLSLPE